MHPAVEPGAVIGEHPPLLGYEELDGIVSEPVESLRFRQGEERLHARPILGEMVARDVDQVFALVALLWHLDPLAEGLAGPDFDGARERLELIAGVIDVVLAVDRPALRAKDARQRVADGRRPGIDDNQRAGGIRRDEFEEIALPRLGPT